MRWRKGGLARPADGRDVPSPQLTTTLHRDEGADVHAQFLFFSLLSRLKRSSFPFAGVDYLVLTFLRLGGIPSEGKAALAASRYSRLVVGAAEYISLQPISRLSLQRMCGWRSAKQGSAQR